MKKIINETPEALTEVTNLEAPAPVITVDAIRETQRNLDAIRVDREKSAAEADARSRELAAAHFKDLRARVVSTLTELRELGPAAREAHAIGEDLINLKLVSGRTREGLERYMDSVCAHHKKIHSLEKAIDYIEAASDQNQFKWRAIEEYAAAVIGNLGAVKTGIAGIMSVAGSIKPDSAGCGTHYDAVKVEGADLIQHAREHGLPISEIVRGRGGKS